MKKKNKMDRLETTRTPVYVTAILLPLYYTIVVLIYLLECTGIILKEHIIVSNKPFLSPRIPCTLAHHLLGRTYGLACGMCVRTKGQRSRAFGVITVMMVIIHPDACRSTLEKKPDKIEIKISKFNSYMLHQRFSDPPGGAKAL